MFHFITRSGFPSRYPARHVSFVFAVGFTKAFSQILFLPPRDDKQAHCIKYEKPITLQTGTTTILPPAHTTRRSSSDCERSDRFPTQLISSVLPRGRRSLTIIGKNRYHFPDHIKSYGDYQRTTYSRKPFKSPLLKPATEP